MVTRIFLKRTFAAVAICAMLSLLTPSLLAAAGTAASDLAPYTAMAKEALQMVTAGNMTGAAKKGQQIESEWDAKGLGGQYPDIDQQMDDMNDALNSGNAKKATTEINKYLQMLDDASK
jgi:hypothetical protein